MSDSYNFFDALELATKELDEHKNVNEVHLNLICVKYAPQSLQASLEAVQNDLALLAAEAGPGFMIHDVIKSTIIRIMREHLYKHLVEKEELQREKAKAQALEQVQTTMVKRNTRGNRR